MKLPTSAYRTMVRLFPFYNRYRAIQMKRKYESWLRGEPFKTPPHLAKAAVVLGHAQRFDIKVLVETGMYFGDMIHSGKEWFEEIHSIELDEYLLKRARRRFRGETHIHLYHGDSAELLPGVVRQLSRPAVFWLDAHHSGWITARGKVVAPIIEELESLFDLSGDEHVVLIDDAHAFAGEIDAEAFGYPSLDQIVDLIRSRRPDWVVDVEADIIQAHAPRNRDDG